MAKAATAELQGQMLAALQALAPATDAVPIVANDNTELAQEAVGIACGGNGGAVKLKTAAGNDRTIAIASGQTIAIRFRKVYLSGTSATGLTALLNPAVVSTPTPAPAPTPQPTLSLTPSSASVSANAVAGYQLATIGNVPAGVTPTLTPNDGRFVIGGSAGTGWVVVLGNAAISAGNVNIAVAASGANGATFALTITAASAPTFAFPAVQTKLAAGQRSQIAIVGDSAVAGWGSGVINGTGGASGPGNPGNYLRSKSWPAQLKDMLIAAGIPCRHDAYFSSAADTNLTNLQAANPNIVIGTGWVLGNYSLSGTILNCPSTVTTATSFTPEIAADKFDIIHSAAAGLGTIVITDADGAIDTINTGTNAGAQVVTASGNGLKRTTISRAVASTKPISIARNGTGGQVFIEAIIPYNSASPCLELLNMGWPGAKAFGTSGSGHWNVYADPSTMSASTPYNALGVLNSDGYIIELGTNDCNSGVAAADFQQAMTNIATKLVGQSSAANVALVKCRTAPGSGYNMPADYLAAVDAVASNLNLKGVINFNAISFVTTDRYDLTHMTSPGYGKEATVARQWFIGA